MNPSNWRLRRLAKDRRRRFLLQLQQLEERASPTSIEPINGVGNNLANPTFGSAGSDLIRIAPAAYADGVGALAEDHAPGADVGPLTRAVLVDQFTRLRDGDRFFYLTNSRGRNCRTCSPTPR
jgi:hypothetical protein